MKPEAPCYGCEFRTAHCHTAGRCSLWADYLKRCEAWSRAACQATKGSDDVHLVRRSAKKRRRYPHV